MRRGVTVVLGWVVAAGCTSGGGGSSGGTSTSSSSSSSSSSSGAPDAGAAVALEPGVWALAGTALDAADGDLEPVRALARGRTVVGIGESIHTSAGFFRMRNRVFQSLIRHEGYRVVVFEASWENVARTMAPYVDSCTGTPQDAALALPNIWWDHSTVEFLTFLCTYNQDPSHPKVRVAGTDIRQPWFDAPAFRAFITQHAPVEGPALANGMDSCLGATFSDERSFFMDATVRQYYDQVTPIPDANRAACESAAQAALAYLSNNRAALDASAGSAAVEIARLRVGSMRAFDETIYWLSRGSLQAGNAARDPGMFDVFTTLRALEFPDASILLWAHNGHVLKDASSLIGSQWTGVPSLGTRLGQTLGAQYVVLGQLAHQTDYHWFDGSQTLPTPVASSIEALLNGYGVPHLFVDLPVATSGATPAVTPGQRYPLTLESPMELAHHYDGLLFHARSEEAVFFNNPFP